MAFDINDPADKKLLADKIAEALAEQAEEHEAEVAGLRAKKTELLDKLKKARSEGGGSPEEVTRLEGEVERLTTELRTATKALAKAEKDRDAATTERDTAVTERDTERTASRDLLVNGELTSSLTAANVPKELLNGASALLRGKVEVKEVNGERKAFVGDKSLGDFITEWSQGDEGKHYVAAPGNGGGGANQTKTPLGGSSKTLAEMGDAERSELARADPQKFAALVEADKQAKRNPPKV